jgi:hypothetical protein
MADSDGVSLRSIAHPLDVEHVNAVAKAIATGMGLSHNPGAWTLCIKAAEAAIRADMAWQAEHPLPDIATDALEEIELEIEERKQKRDDILSGSWPKDAS